MWGPKDVTQEGPTPLRNVVTSNQKVPLTEIENALGLTPGASTGPDAIENLTPYRVPGSKAKISFATSLPAFVYNGGPVTPFAQAPPAGVDPCTDTARFYMYCMEKLGTNLGMHDEATRTLGDSAGCVSGGRWMELDLALLARPDVSFDYT